MMKQKKNLMINNQKGFTLIEIIAVLVILGLLAVVAVPRYMNLQAQASAKAAMGVWGACNSGASLNFANGILTPAGHTPVTNAATLIATLQGAVAPQGWTGASTTLTDSSGTYVITVTTAEVTGVSRAVLTKTGF